MAKFFHPKQPAPAASPARRRNRKSFYTGNESFLPAAPISPDGSFSTQKKLPRRAHRRNYERHSEPCAFAACPLLALPEENLRRGAAACRKAQGPWRRPSRCSLKCGASATPSPRAGRPVAGAGRAGARPVHTGLCRACQRASNGHCRHFSGAVRARRAQHAGPVRPLRRAKAAVCKGAHLRFRAQSGPLRAAKIFTPPRWTPPAAPCRWAP